MIKAQYQHKTNKSMMELKWKYLNIQNGLVQAESGV